MTLLADTGLIYRGIRPLQKLGASAKDLALNRLLVDHIAGLAAMRERIPRRLTVVPPDPWAGDAQRGRDMIAGSFRFAGQTIERENLSWAPVGAKPEWVADLHRFEFLRDLRSVGGDRARRMAREMVGSWLESHDKMGDIAGRPDVVGTRLASWISFHDFFCAAADDEFRVNYFTSIVKQARHLMRSLPGNLSGIALMQALKGLAYTGIALEDGSERLEFSFRLLLKEMKDQILPDGAHISRSPQATFEFLQVLVDLRTALTAAKLDMPGELQHAIDKITPALKFFRHGDGALCQFNGGQEENSNIIDATLMHSGARGKAMKSLSHAGFEKIIQGRSSLIMDIGLPLSAVKHNPRAHAGLLAFEYSFGKDRVIVNCGTSATAGKWRDILKSTAAHSTVVVDNRNSCQFDEKGGLATRPEVRASVSEDAQIAMIEASHNGYTPRFGLAHRRTVRLLDQGDVLKGEDQLQGRSGVAYAVRFHLHPGIQASLINEGTEILLRARSGNGWRFKADGMTMAIEDSIFMNEGDTPRKSLQIALSGMTAGPVTSIHWEMKREKI